MAVRAAALLALLGLVALVAAQGGNPATVGFATPPGFGTGEVNGWLNISPGQVLAVPISMVAGTSIRLSNFNMYVRHPNKADLNGAFWYGLYADVSGVPGGACLAPLRDTVLPYADGPDSRIVNDAINATFQTIAWTGNPVVFTAGARYWLCMASSLTLGIFANFAGTTPIMLAAADMSNPYPDLTGRTFPYFSVPNGGLTAASVDLFLTVLSNAPTLATGATSTATTATVAATVAGPVTVAATSAGPVTVAATTATVAGPATVATVGTTGAGAGTTSSATAPPGGTLPPGQAVLGFSDFPPAATASWIVVRAGTAMAVPVTASLAGATSASLLSFNLYVRHPNKLAVPGPFYIALYASDGGGNPIGAPLGQVSPASFPWGNVVSYAFNFTLQTFAPSAAVNIVPGAKYWLAVASSATDLNIYSDTSATGTTPMKLALSGGTLPTLAAGSSFWLNPSNGFTANTNMFIIVQSNAAALASVLTITTMSSAGTSTGPAPAAATTGPTTGPTTNGATLVGPTTGAATVATVATVAGPTTGGAATVAGTTAGTGGTLPPVTAAGTPIPTSTTGSTGSQTFTYGWVHTIGSVITFAPAPNGVAVNVTIPPQLGVAAYNFVGWEVEIQHPLRQDVTGSFSFALYDNDPTTGRPVGAPLATASSSVFAWSAQATWPTSQNATNQIVNAAQPKALLPTRTYWVYLGSSVPINVFAACPGDQQMFVAAPPAPNPAIASSFILFNRCNMALKIRVTTVVGPTSLTTGPPAGVTATTGSSTAASALAATSSTAATSAAVVAATSAATVASTSAVASLTSTASATGNTLPPTASSVAAVAATSAAAAAAATVSSVATSAAATAATSGASVTTGGPLPSGDASVGFSDPPTGTSIAWITIIKGQSLAIPVDLTLPGATTAVLKSFNAYVRHANQQAITGPFYFGLYASGTDGKPIGTPLGAVTVASFPFSGVVSAGANVTLQSFAAAAGANLTPGNKYWIAVAVDPTASASLNIISDINGPTLFLLAMTGGPLPNVAAGSNFWLSPSGFNTADTRMFITVGTDAVSLATGPTVSTFGSLASTTSTAAAAGAGGATTAAGPTTGQGVTVTSNGAGPTTNGGATITSGATNGGSSTTATTAASTTNAIAASTSTVSNSLTSATTTSVASTVTAAAASTSTTASTTAVTSTAFASGGATGTTTAASTTSTVATTTSTVAATTSASTSTTAATDAATTTSFSSTTAAAGNSNSGGSGKHRKGLPGWAVALIVIAVIIAVIIIVLLIVLIIVKGSSSGGYVDMDKQQSKK